MALAVYNGFNDKQRTAAYAWLKREYAAGRRVKPVECEACGQRDGLVMAHSEDYSAPYGDHIGRFSLCFRCHMLVHCRARNRPAFDRYVGELEAGFRYAGLDYSRGDPFGRYIKPYLWGGNDGICRPDAPGGDPGLLRRIADGAYLPPDNRQERLFGE